MPLDTRTSFFSLSKELIRLDFPTLLLPIKAYSGIPLPGNLYLKSFGVTNLAGDVKIEFAWDI
jgi:hypothetical protein